MNRGFDFDEVVDRREVAELKLSPTYGVETTRASGLQQSRHELDQVARARSVVELDGDDRVPGGLACAGGARQTEDIGGVGDAGERP